MINSYLILESPLLHLSKMSQMTFSLDTTSRKFFASRCDIRLYPYNYRFALHTYPSNKIKNNAGVLVSSSVTSLKHKILPNYFDRILGKDFARRPILFLIFVFTCQSNNTTKIILF